MAQPTTTTKKAAAPAPAQTQAAPAKASNGLAKKPATAAPATPADPYQRYRDANPTGWARVTEYAKLAERDLDDIVAEIQETVEEDYLQKIPEAQRLRTAIGVVSARLTVEGLTTADNYLLLVLAVEQPRTIKTKNGPKNIATIRGIAAKYNEAGEAGDASFAEVAFWEDEADKVNDAVVSQAYDIKLAGQYKDGRFQLKGTPKTNWQKKTELEVEPLDILKQLYPKLDLADIGEAAKQKKPVLVHGQVTFSRSGKSQGGNQYGIITIFDDTQKLDERGISVFCNAQDAVHGTGSSLWILGTCSPGKKNPETGEMYNASMNALVIIPEFSVPVAFSKQTTKEAAKIGDDDEVETVDFTAFSKKKAEAAAEAEPATESGEGEEAPAEVEEAEEEEAAPDQE